MDFHKIDNLLKDSSSQAVTDDEIYSAYIKKGAAISGILKYGPIPSCLKEKEKTYQELSINQASNPFHELLENPPSPDNFDNSEFFQKYNIEEILEELLREDLLIPPLQDILKIRRILIAIHFVFTYLRPSNYTIQAFMKLDLIALIVMESWGRLNGGFPFAEKKLSHIKKVVSANKKQADKTMDKILDAYHSLRPIWPNSNDKKPITLQGKQISINKLGDKITDKMKEIYASDNVPSQRWVIECLKKARKSGRI